MKNEKRLLIFLITVFTLTWISQVPSYCISAEAKTALPEETVALKYLFNFNQLQPKLNQAYIIAYVKSIALDDDANVYYCDSDKNRVVKLSLNGKFLKQIGGGGADNVVLSYPSSISVKNRTIYLADKGGERVSAFDLNGKPLNSFSCEKKSFLPIKNIVVEGSGLFLQTDKMLENWNDCKLISKFSLNGKQENSFGKTLKANRRRSFEAINDAHLLYRDKKIYGAYMFAPIIFCYDAEGKELMYKQLNLTPIDEDIDDVFDKADGEDYSRNSRRRIRMINYIWGFSLDRKGNILLAVNNFGMRKGMVLVLSPDGKPTKKIRFTHNGKYVFPIERIVQGPKGRTFICAQDETRDSIFFEMPNKNKENKK